MATWGTFGFFLVLGGAAYFAPAAAYVVPALSLLLLALRVVAARRATEPARWGVILTQAVSGVALAVPIHLWPRWAFTVPTGVAVLVLINARKGSGGTARFERARARIRFHGHAYR